MHVNVQYSRHSIAICYLHVNKCLSSVIRAKFLILHTFELLGKSRQRYKRPEISAHSQISAYPRISNHPRISVHFNSCLGAYSRNYGILKRQGNLSDGDWVPYMLCKHLKINLKILQALRGSLSLMFRFQTPSNMIFYKCYQNTLGQLIEQFSKLYQLCGSLR